MLEQRLTVRNRKASNKGKKFRCLSKWNTLEQTYNEKTEI